MTLEVLPELGASVLNLRAASGRPVLRPVAVEDVQTSSQCASFVLLPYSNRIRDARFTFEVRRCSCSPTPETAWPSTATSATALGRFCAPRTVT